MFACATIMLSVGIGGLPAFAEGEQGGAPPVARVYGSTETIYTGDGVWLNFYAENFSYLGGIDIQIF